MKVLARLVLISPCPQDKAVRLRCLRVNGFFLWDDQSDRFFLPFWQKVVIVLILTRMHLAT